MEFNTDVLIVGAGPTGLMMACQLLRFGVRFRIIDEQVERTHESRAIGVQAKSVEIFQNLGIASEFLKRAHSNLHIYLYVKGKECLKINPKIDKEDTPFPSLFLIPQPETEGCLLKYLEKHGKQVERHTKLMSFSQTAEAVCATIHQIKSNQSESIYCKYIVGCDGAHSSVRHILNIPFVGASYKQEFFLADVKQVVWPFISDDDSAFRVFFNKKGIFLYIPLYKELKRIMGAQIEYTEEKKDVDITQQEIDHLAREITHRNVELKEYIWKSRFYLHHRAVKQYQKGRAFLAGDAAHIHSPVAAQGMNTGLQDATNLAWKIAWVIKWNVSDELLETYHLERQRVGEKLLRTTDRFFGLITSKKWIAAIFRQFILPFFFRIVNKSIFIQQRIFHFASQLEIYYPFNQFIIEQTEGADKKFREGPKAGHRAPDAPLQHTTLFDLFQKAPSYILIFLDQGESITQLENKLSELTTLFGNWVGIYRILKSSETQVAFNRYGISKSGIYFIRPDGYIGFRAYGINIEHLKQYLNMLFKKN